ncbi:beta-microseminoprotein-like [Festucalex cinctus]
MRAYLSLALLLLLLLPQSNAFCMFRPPELGESETKCLDEVDNKWYPVGSSWRNSECMDCTCRGCCSAFSIPRNFPDDCVSMFDKAACRYRVHKWNDSSIECPIFRAVGK